MGWVRAAQTSLPQDGPGWAGITVVQRIEPDGRLRSGGSQVRVTFKAASDADGSIAAAFVGYASGSGDDYDFDAAPTQLFFGGASPQEASVEISAGGEVVSDPVDFELDASKTLLIAAYTAVASPEGDSFAFSTTAPDGWRYFFKEANEAATVNKSGYTAAEPNSASHVSKVEIFFERAVWPDNVLPNCPLEAFTITPDPAVIRTQTESGLARQRRMFGRTISRLQTSWAMTGEQLEFFKSWYEHKAGAGSVWFLITLLVDQEQRTYEVRFTDPPTYSFWKQDNDADGPLWKVDFQLEAITPPPLSAEALDVVLGIGLVALFGLQELLVPPVTLQPAFDNWLAVFPG